MTEMISMLIGGDSGGQGDPSLVARSPDRFVAFPQQRSCSRRCGPGADRCLISTLMMVGVVTMR